ncbi:MAG: hypothetical protein GX564_13965 [Oligosphaeraceae bacterium]|jgi:hypothetical protein|nr:hypothetical protein [Oligosphaeraceae bacterium]
MKCRTIIYINPDDPRVFVYKHDKYKWLGVTFNFARGRSYVALMLILLPVLLWPLVLILDSQTLPTALPVITFLLLYFVWICLYCFRGAAKDLARYPGPLSKR